MKKTLILHRTDSNLKIEIKSLLVTCRHFYWRTMIPTKLTAKEIKSKRQIIIHYSIIHEISLQVWIHIKTE